MVCGLVARFLIGGAIVSAFATLGTMFTPRTFAGLFGAAPSVGIATLALTFSQNGPHDAAIQARAMLIGALAMTVYCAVCIALVRRQRVPVWLAAGASWITWFAVALGGLALARELGVR